MSIDVSMLSQVVCMLGDQSEHFCEVKLIVMKNVIQMSSNARVNNPISKQVFSTFSKWAKKNLDI